MTPVRSKKRSFRYRLSQMHLPIARPKHSALANHRACPPRISAEETTDLDVMADDEDTHVREATSMLAGRDWEGVPGEDFNRSLEFHSDVETVLVVGPGCECTYTATSQQKRKKKFVVDKEQLRHAIFTAAHHSSNFIHIVLRSVRLMRIPLFILLFLILAVDRRLRLHVHLWKGVQQLIWGQVGGKTK